MNYVLPYTNNIDVSPNEVIVNPVLNRNFEKLLKNDEALDNLRGIIDSGGIKSYVAGQHYKKGDLVWFKSKSKFTGNIILYLLRNILENNSNTPSQSYYNDRYTFTESGWEDMNEYASVLENDLSGYILKEAHKDISNNHENSEQHKYGQLRTESGSIVDSKFLKKDLSNISQKRKNLFFPYETISLSTNNVVTNGFYRRWDNGLLEYNITFKLGYFGEKRIVLENEYEVYKCNTLSIEDNKYINNTSDADIFIEDTKNEVFLNNHYEINRSNFVNTYSQKLVFDIPFIDTNYMVFTSNIRNIQTDLIQRSVSQTQNSLTFINKKPDSICPVYIMNGVDQDGTNNGLLANTFHCQIIGKWK